EATWILFKQLDRLKTEEKLNKATPILEPLHPEYGAATRHRIQESLIPNKLEEDALQEHCSAASTVIPSIAGKAPLWLANAWGKCQDGPNVRVVQDTYNAMRIRTPSNAICVGFELQDVETFVASFFFEDFSKGGLLSMSPIES
ncbi:LOW QUALITY PROTEIN: hypothetical protein HID58_054379, partial [Brassica napus]